jgi:hypothetical protein
MDWLKNFLTDRFVNFGNPRGPIVSRNSGGNSVRSERQEFGARSGFGSTPFKQPPPPVNGIPYYLARPDAVPGEMPPGNPFAFEDSLMRELMGINIDPDAQVAAAAAAYNPAINALKAERGQKISRNKKNVADIKENYADLAMEQLKQSKAEAKAGAKAQEEINRNTTRGAQETSSTYNKLKAEQQATAKQLGIQDTSSQALAKAALERQAQEQVDFQKNQGSIDAQAMKEMTAMNSDYYKQGVATAKQESAEQQNYSNIALEGALQALDKELAGLKTQQGTAKASAQGNALSQVISKINAGLGIEQSKRDLMATLFPQMDPKDMPKFDDFKGQQAGRDYLQTVRGVSPADAARYEGILDLPAFVNDRFAPSDGDFVQLTDAKARQLAIEYAKNNGLDPAKAVEYVEIVRRG